MTKPGNKVTSARTLVLAAPAAATRKTLRDALAADGYGFVEVTDGRQCLESCAQTQPVAVFLDAGIEQPDAFACCRELRRQTAGRNPVLLMVTAADREQTAERAFAAGVDDYLSQATPAGILRQRLRHLLQAGENRAEIDRLRRNYQLLLTHAGEGIVGLDQEGRHTFINAAAQSLLGYTTEELLGQSNYDLWQPRFEKGGTSAADACPISRTLHDGETCRNQDGLFWRKDGSPLPVEYVCTPILEHDRVAGAVLMFRDISDQKQREEERQTFDEQLRQTQKLESLGILAGGIAHDFNNLLMIILGNAELILEQLPAGSPFRGPLEALQHAGQRATELSKQMLTYAGRVILTLSSVNLNTVLQGMHDLLQAIVSKKTKLSFDCAGSLPIIEADVAQLRQILFNLVTNGTEAIGDAPGGIAIRTGVAHLARQDFRDTAFDANQPEGEYVFLQVSDSGCGMDAKTRERMFDPFFSTKFTGRGLGLATVYGIVRSHGGAIKVQSAPGDGTVITVYFRSNRVFPHAAVSETIPLTGRGETILVVDDEPAIIEVVRYILERSNYKVLTARDGVEALEVIQKRGDELAIVLLDLKMPRMSGEQVFPIIHRTRPKLPVVLTTGYSQHEALQTFGSLGMAGFLQKPYEARKLLEELANVLRH